MLLSVAYQQAGGGVGGGGFGLPWLDPDNPVLFLSMPCLQLFTSITPWMTGNVLLKTTLNACRYGDKFYRTRAEGEKSAAVSGAFESLQRILVGRCQGFAKETCHRHGILENARNYP